MALLVVLVPTERNEAALGPKAVEALAQLGVTTVSLARDERTVAVVLDGWAFDARCPEAALAALGTVKEGVQTLQPVMQMAVSTATTEGGIR